MFNDLTELLSRALAHLRGPGYQQCLGFFIVVLVKPLTVSGPSPQPLLLCDTGVVRLAYPANTTQINNMVWT